MARSRSRERPRRDRRSRDRRSRERKSRSRDRRRAERERELEDHRKEQRETEEMAARIEAEVQRRVQDRISAPEFEAVLQEKLDAEMERHFSLLRVEVEMAKKKAIEDFKQQRETEERSKQELEEIIRVNQQRAQEQQQKASQAQAIQAEALMHERDMLQKSWDQRKKKINLSLRRASVD